MNVIFLILIYLFFVAFFLIISNHSINLLDKSGRDTLGYLSKSLLIKSSVNLKNISAYAVKLDWLP